MGWLKKIICIVLIIVAIMYGIIIFFPEIFASVFGQAFMAAAISIVSGHVYLAAAIALIGAAIIDPNTTTQAFTSIGSAVGTVGGAVIDGAVAVGTGILSGSKWLWVAAAAVVGYFLLSDNGKQTN